jgi:hypothetical protein
MPTYVRADGSIAHGVAPPRQGRTWGEIAVLCSVAALALHLLSLDWDAPISHRGGKNDLADNNVPAADRSDHWAFIYENRKTFVRHYTRHADKGSLLNLPEWRDFVENGGASTADAGGQHRHTPEDFDVMGTATDVAESIAVTRCTSTNYAVSHSRIRVRARARSRIRTGRHAHALTRMHARAPARTGDRVLLRLRCC